MERNSNARSSDLVGGIKYVFLLSNFSAKARVSVIYETTLEANEIA